MRKLTNNWILLATLSFALLLRVYAFGQAPPSLNWDEVSHGYNAYSILTTGKDEWGVSWPTIFRAYGDYKLPVYIYLTSLSEAIFGLNEFAVRFPSMIAGLGSIIFSFLLARRLWGEKIGIITALLLATEPWSFFLSRGAFEANLGQFFVIAGIYLFFLGVEKVKWLPVSAFLFGLSVWTYNSERIFVPIFLVFLLFLHRDNIAKIWKKNYTLVAGAILLLFFLPMFVQLVKQEGQARYSNVAIVDQGAINYIESVQRDNPVLRIIVNKYTYFGYHFISNWTKHFSTEFLFLKGGSQYQFNIPNTGLLYITDIPFLLLGFYLILKKRDRNSLMILGWMLFAPLASSLTREAPHTLRAITFLPIPMILSATGIIYILEKLSVKRVNYRVLSLCLLLAFGFSSFIYLKKYFTDYQKNYSWTWQYGYKQVVGYSKAHYNEYDQIIITKKYGEPHEFFLFYWPWDPEKYRSDSKLVRYPQSNWFWVDSFDKFVFVNDWDIPKDKNEGWITERKKDIDVYKKTLLVTSPNTYPPGWNKLETVDFLDGKPAFEILEN